MVKALSFDLRVRVLAAAAGGMSHREAAQMFAVSPAGVSRWRKLSRETGVPRAKAAGRNNRSHHVEAHRDLILALLEETHDLTIEELRGLLSASKVAAKKMQIYEMIIYLLFSDRRDTDNFTGDGDLL